MNYNDISPDEPTALFEDIEGGSIIVYPRCENCGRFIKHGNLLTNLLGHIKFENWICKKHGEVDPFYWERT